MLFSSQIGLTGAFIGTEKAGSIGSIIGLILIIGGVVGMMVEERKKIESRIEELVASGVSRNKINLIQERIKENYGDLSKEKRKIIYGELANVISEVQSGKRVGGSYNLHTWNIIPVGLRNTLFTDKILEGDAKILNRYINQDGRGTERYIFDNNTGDILGIAYHPRGNSRDLRWRFRF